MIATTRRRFSSVAHVVDSRAIVTSSRRRTSPQRTCSSPLCTGPSGRGPHLADPVHNVPSGFHDPATFHLALSPDAPRSCSRCPLGHPWRSELGALCGDPSYLTDGPL